MTSQLRPSAKSAILDAGFAVFSRDPSASLAHVAEVAGVGRATLHRYFPSRSALIAALSRIAMTEMDEAVEHACRDASSYSKALEVTLLTLIPMGDRVGFLMLEDVAHDADLTAAFERQRKETTDIIDHAKQEGTFDAAVPTSWIVQAFDHLLFAAWQSVKSGEATPTQAADLAWRTLTNGLAKGTS